MTKKRYTIDELCDKAALTRRTVRYYVHEGILEPPAGRGRGGFYYDSHLDKLLRIKSLQDQGLRLAAIRKILAGEGDGAPERASDCWIRMPLVEGVEIHVRMEKEKEFRRELGKLTQIARDMLRNGGGK